jgi:zinc/manganese transport system permease protein
MLEWLIQNNIICHAVEAMLFSSITCGMLGVIIARMNISSIGFTMAHAAFAGAAVGIFFGLNGTLVALIFSVLLAAMLGPLSHRSRMSTDATLGVLFAMSMAIAVVFISYMQYLGKGFNASGLMFGDIMSLFREDIYGLALVSAIIVLFVIAFNKEIMAIMLSMRIAEASGIRTKPIFFALLFIIAVAVALNINIVGGLLIYVWLVAPAAIAYQFCYDMKSMLIVGPLLSAILSVAGVLIGFEYSLPIGPLTAVIFTVAFAVAVVISPKRRVTSNKT